MAELPVSSKISQLETIIDAVITAGDKIVEIYESDFKVEKKDAKSATKTKKWECSPTSRTLLQRPSRCNTDCHADCPMDATLRLLRFAGDQQNRVKAISGPELWIKQDLRYSFYQSIKRYNTLSNCERQ